MTGFDFTRTAQLASALECASDWLCEKKETAEGRVRPFKEAATAAQDLAAIVQDTGAAPGALEDAGAAFIQTHAIAAAAVADAACAKSADYKAGIAEWKRIKRYVAARAFEFGAIGYFLKSGLLRHILKMLAHLCDHPPASCTVAEQALSDPAEVIEFGVWSLADTKTPCDTDRRVLLEALDEVAAQRSKQAQECAGEGRRIMELTSGAIRLADAVRAATPANADAVAERIEQWTITMFTRTAIHVDMALLVGRLRSASNEWAARLKEPLPEVDGP